MAADSRTRSGSPWYLRGRTALLGIGALAGAVLTVWGLWDRLFPADETDLATITLVEVTRQVSLSEFTAGRPCEDAFTAALSDSALKTVPVQRLFARAAEGLGGQPTPSSRTTSPPTDDPSPTGTPTPRSSERWAPTDSFVAAVVDSRVLDEYALSGVGGESEDIAIPIVLPSPVDPSDPAGSDLSTEEVASRLADALDEVEAENKEGKKDPLGWGVAVNMTVAGLDGVPLLLTWSLDGIDAASSWAADNFACRLTATTADDAGSVEIWVPDLEQPGAYNVNVLLARAVDGIVLTRGQPARIENG